MWIAWVGYKENQVDPLGRNTKKDIDDLGIQGVSDVRTLQTYIIEGDVSREDINKICRELLTDSVTQNFLFKEMTRSEDVFFSTEKGWVVEAFFKPGVMDSVGMSVNAGIKVLGIEGVKNVRTGTTYIIKSPGVLEVDIEKICAKCLANGLIQDYRYRKG